MSVMFDRLAHLFERGHAAPSPDLLTDARFADLDRTADAAGAAGVSVLAFLPPRLRRVRLVSVALSVPLP